MGDRVLRHARERAEPVSYTHLDVYKRQSFSRDDIRYAAEMTRVVYEPDRRIDTFGDTRFNFLLLSELMDEAGVVRVRSGWVEAEKPKIIRPSVYNEVSTEGFSGEAKRFFDWLSKNGPGFLTLLEYGFRFKRSEVNEEIPVSYTHLDVYKRQRQLSANRSA